jgi:Flp pilus assembly protein TadD
MQVFSVLLLFLTGGMNLDSLSASLHVETGLAYLEQGLLNRAVIEFTRALEISDAAVEAYIGLGRAAALNGAWSTAEENYITYMELKPFDHRPAVELAEMLTGLFGRHSEAVEYASCALALAPTDGRCRLAAANAMTASGEASRAETLYRRVITENTEYETEARLRLGALLFSNGNLTDARTVLLPAAFSGEAEAHRFLCMIYLDQNDRLRAGDSAGRYLFLAPNGHWADSARTILEDVSFESFYGNQGE